MSEINENGSVVCEVPVEDTPQSTGESSVLNDSEQDIMVLKTNTKTLQELIQEILERDRTLSTKAVAEKLQQEFGREAHQTLIDKVKREMKIPPTKVIPRRGRPRKNQNVLQEERITKAELIRRYLAMDESLRPCEIREKILTDHGIDIGNAGAIYTIIKNYFKNKGKTQPKYPYSNNRDVLRSRDKAKVNVESPKRDTDSFSLDKMQRFVDVVKSIGGVKIARKLLDILEN